MKKVIVFTIVLMMACSIFAASSWSSTKPDTSTGTGVAPSQIVELVIDENIYSYNVGFSTDGIKAEEDIGKTTMKLSDDKTVAEGASDLFVWWDIFTSKKFQVSIKTSGALTQINPTEVGNPAKIDFTVDGEIQTGEKKPETGGADAIDITSVTSGTGAGDAEMVFLSSSDSTVAQNFKGSQKLTIKTVADALSNKPEDTYQATLTITVSSGV